MLILIASFGELSFNANFVHTKRNGSVISDGSHGNDHDWTQDDDENHCRTDRRHQRMKDDSNATILLLIPEKTYMSELYGFHAAKHQTKEKVSSNVWVISVQVGTYIHTIHTHNVR